MIGNIDIAGFAVWFLAFLFSTTCHEAAHAWAAHVGGDSTAYEGGQASLDPVPHVRRSPIGMVLAPILTFFFWGYTVGWASAPYDPVWGNRYPKRHAVMALAGPGANFTLALFALLVTKGLILGGILDAAARPSLWQLAVAPGGIDVGALAAIAKLLSVLVLLNVLLGMFNLMPIPPLDGAAVLEGFFQKQVGRFYQMLRESPGLSILMFLVVWNVFPRIWGPVAGVVGGFARFVVLF